jgi:hypothetical protein
MTNHQAKDRNLEYKFARGKLNTYFQNEENSL